jgi:hypothetical protein
MSQAKQQAEETTFEFAEELIIPVTFGHLHRDKDGKPITFKFKIRQETGEDLEALRSRFAGRTVSDHERMVARLAAIMLEMPKELDSFKQNGDMRKSVADYFSNKKAEYFVRGILNNYDRAVAPDELFR